MEIGQAPGAFHFDNEAPQHREWLEPFAIADRLVTNADYASFIADGGYRRPDLWMSEGWAVAQARGWESPRYWRGEEEFTLAGRQPRQARAPVRHLSWFEADAFARWAGARLPSGRNGKRPPPPAASPRCSGCFGSGPAVRTVPIRVSHRHQGPWGNTTASS